MRVELCARILRFGRFQRYLLGLSDEVCKYVLKSLDAEITDIFLLLISEKIILRFNGVKDTSIYAMASV